MIFSTISFEISPFIINFFAKNRKKTTNQLVKELTMQNFDDEVFIKEMERFETERNTEEEELKIQELRENEESKKKDSLDLDIFYPSNYYPSILSKSKVNKIFYQKNPFFSKVKPKIPNSAGLTNYRFSALKNPNSAPNVSSVSPLNNKLKSNKEITSYSPLSKPTSSFSSPNNNMSFSPQPHKTSLILQSSEKCVINIKFLLDFLTHREISNEFFEFSLIFSNFPLIFL